MIVDADYSEEEYGSELIAKCVMTAFQYNHSFGFQKPMKMKVVK